MRACTKFPQHFSDMTSLAYHFHKLFTFSCRTHGRSTPDRRYQASYLEIQLRYLVCQFLNFIIFHINVDMRLEQTKIDESKGERWFCTEAEARAAGSRAPK